MTDLTDGELKSVLASLAVGRIGLKVRAGTEQHYGMGFVYQTYVHELTSAEEKLRAELHEREKARR